MFFIGDLRLEARLFYKKKVQKVFTKTKNILHFFYKNNVNWSRGWVVLKFSLVLNNMMRFSRMTGAFFLNEARI